jgi:ADP-ribose pyrophosphatase YjhB (NUDIX family)
VYLLSIDVIIFVTHTHEHTVLREVRTEAGQRDLHLRQAVFFVSAEAEETVEH